MLPTRIAVICGAAALLSSAGLGSAAASAACGAQAGCAQAEADGVGLLQHPAGRRPHAGTAEGRISPRSGAFTLGGKEVLLLGGNYVWKAAPYLPPLEVVERNAAEIAAGLRAAAYEPRPGADGEPRAKVPCVRLGAMFEAMMPEAGKVDAAWLQRLSQAIEAFGRHGVYVFLDAHSDAWSTTNGGEGFPWWMGAYMQETAEKGQSFITSPEHPLELALTPLLNQQLEQLGVKVPEIKTMPNDSDPWKNFSLGSGAGSPRNMNVGNLNMRLNNNDGAWQNRTLLFTKQVQNSYYRFLTSFKHPEDKIHLFAPYVEFVRQLFLLWEKHSNVIAVELLNEPPPNGLPCLLKAKQSRTTLWSFYAHVLDELDKCGVPIGAPVALQDVAGALEGASPLDAMLETNQCGRWETAKLRKWAAMDKMVLSFHYYPGNEVNVGLEEMMRLGHAQAAKLGEVPIFFSEFWRPTAQQMADVMVQAADLGADAVAYWHFVDSSYTGQPGWFIYPESVLDIGVPVGPSGEVNPGAWDEYLKTVQAGTFVGADICGARGGQSDVLRRLSPGVVR